MVAIIQIRHSAILRPPPTNTEVKFITAHRGKKFNNSFGSCGNDKITAWHLKITSIFRSEPTPRPFRLASSGHFKQSLGDEWFLASFYFVNWGWSLASIIFRFTKTINSPAHWREFCAQKKLFSGMTRGFKPDSRGQPKKKKWIFLFFH